MCEESSNLCRCCMGETGKFNIFETEFETKTIANLIKNYAQCKISSTDQLPKNVCEDCLNQLITFHIFIRKFKEVQILLNSSLEETEKDVESKENSQYGFKKKYFESSLSTMKQEDILCDFNPGIVKLEILYDDSSETNNIENEFQVKEESEKSYEIFVPKEYSCATCDEIFLYVKDVQEHCRLTGHKLPRRFNCQMCPKKFSSGKLLKVHMRVHTNERPFECDLCGDKFITSTNLLRHKRGHTGEKPYICEICGRGFSQRYNRTTHMKSHADGKEPMKSKAWLKEECNICRKMIGKSNLKTHFISKHGGGKDFLCNICGKTYPTKFSLDCHVNFHTKKIKYECNVCFKTFYHPQGLNAHLLLHSGEKPHCCELCGMTFRQRSHLNRHMKTHTGARPFVCEYCDKAFALNENLKAHTRIHTGERPFTCSVCQKGFISLTAKKNHEVKEHQVGVKKS